MVYISPDGSVAQKRTPWRLSIVTDTFMAIFEMIGLLFGSLTNPPDRNVRILIKEEKGAKENYSIL